MSKVAFIFPGQGAQYVGMGKDFYEQIEVSREMFELAGKAADLDVTSLCFEENQRIHITEYTQIAMLATEVAILKAIEKNGNRPDVTAGLSLGEYGALTAAGVMSPEDIFRVVRKRGIYMQEAVPSGGAMTAVLGLPADLIEKICEETEGIVSIANYNCPGQIVITGEVQAVEDATEALLTAGAKKCIPLNVSGPFHSSLMAGAGERLDEVLQNVEIQNMAIPYISNVTADYVTDKKQVKQLLIRQVSSPVRWQQSVERMIADGIDTFIEIGPGKTLSGFIRKINKGVKAVNIERVEDLEKLDTIY
ncbi:MAG: ACP S-malonyltransferase [Clostridiales bacterium]|nr:ACP S-malonyltransferase [Clostridiales bacterium]